MDVRKKWRATWLQSPVRQVPIVCIISFDSGFQLEVGTRLLSSGSIWIWNGWGRKPAKANDGTAVVTVGTGPVMGVWVVGSGVVVVLGASVGQGNSRHGWKETGRSWPAQNIGSTKLPFSIRQPTIRSAVPAPHVAEHWIKVVNKN